MVVIRINSIIRFTFTLRKSSCPQDFLNGIPLPSAVVKYLGLYIDKRLTWNLLILIKRQEVNVRYRLLLDNRSHLSLKNKLLLYNTLLKPSGPMEWSCGGRPKSNPSNQGSSGK
jgi:hypothetical protein